MSWRHVLSVRSFEVPLDRERMWEIECGIMHMRRLDGLQWESETALPAQRLGLCVSKDSVFLLGCWHLPITCLWD